MGESFGFDSDFWVQILALHWASHFTFLAQFPHSQKGKGMRNKWESFQSKLTGSLLSASSVSLLGVVRVTGHHVSGHPDLCQASIFVVVTVVKLRFPVFSGSDIHIPGSP